MKTVCIVQARTTSSRFPMKILAGLHGRPMLAHVLERAAAIKGVDQVVLAVPKNDVQIVSHLWPHVYGGSEKDVLGRYVGAAEQYEADVIVRVTGDTPLLATNLASRAVACFRNENYLAMCQPYNGTADGWDIEVMTIHAVREANKQAKKEEREHVTTWMRKSLRVATIKIEDYTALKCSVDTREDLQRVEKIMNHLEDKADFSYVATWKAWQEAGRP